MDPTSIAQLLSLAMRLAIEGAALYPALREVLTGDDREKLDALYAEMKAKSDAVADRLRATPDDPG